MKRKVFFAVIYATTSISLLGFFDAFYGAGPVPYHPLTHCAIGGSVLFAIACVVSLFHLRSGIVCALVASLFCWPFFAGELSMVLRVWRSLVSVVVRDYGMWNDRLAALLTLMLSSAFSLSQLRRFWQAPPAG
jgi:hypothetical protein